MRREDLNRKLERLHDAAERISANLVELEIDSSRQTLEASTLEGESAARRSAANEALTELWRRRELLESLLERADKLRGPRHVEELQRLLRERSIEFGSSDVPLAERNLLGGAQTAERCSADELLAGMSTAFDKVKAVIAQVDRAWTTLVPQLDGARRMLEETSRLAEALGEPSRSDLDSASRALNALTRLVATDPLSVDEGEVARLATTLQTIRDDLERTSELKKDFDERIREARELLVQIQDAVREGQAAREEALLKISAVQLPPAPEGVENLGPELDGIAQMGHEGAWREARRALEDWRARANALLDRAQQTLDAGRAPIEMRNQYRALLEAYQVKAKRLGVLEDPRVADICGRAQDAL